MEYTLELQYYHNIRTRGGTVQGHKIPLRRGNRTRGSLCTIKEKNVIVALGGGAFMNEKIREAVKKLSISFWLDLEPKYLFPRIKMNKRRPLLNSKNLEQDVKNLYEKRKKTYSLADYKIDCNLKTKEEITKEVVKIYENI